MGTLRDPSTINNVGTLGGATNPTTAQALPLERENQKAIRELVGTFGYEALTISSGGITPTKAEVTVDTEAGASADDLTTIYLVSDGTTTLHDGMLLKLRAYDPARAVTVKHGSGTNQIQTVSGTDIVLGTNWDLTLKLQSGVWKEIAGKPVVDIAGNAATATDLASGSILSVAKGGTGATNSEDARTALDVYSKAYVDTVVDNGPAYVGPSPRLTLSTTGADAIITVADDNVCLTDAGGVVMRARNVSLSINTAASGANGLDTGTLSMSTWYAVWIIGKSDGTVSGLISTSFTSPSLPSGYTYKCRIGAIRTDATANKYPLGMIQRGRVAQYKTVAGGNLTALPSMAGGSTGGVLVAVSTSAFIPPTAVAITVTVLCVTNSVASVSPNAHAPYVQSYLTASGWHRSLITLLLEGGSIYWATADGSSNMTCVRWEDDI